MPKASKNTINFGSDDCVLELSTRSKLDGFQDPGLGNRARNWIKNQVWGSGIPPVLGPCMGSDVDPTTKNWLIGFPSQFCYPRGSASFLCCIPIIGRRSQYSSHVEIFRQPHLQPRGCDVCPRSGSSCGVKTSPIPTPIHT